MVRQMTPDLFIEPIAPASDLRELLLSSVDSAQDSPSSLCAVCARYLHGSLRAVPPGRA
jgi:hypothetical protein